MTLEEAIQQKRFRNEHLKVMVNVLFTQSWLEEKIKKFLEQQHITMQQYNILRILRGSGTPLSTMQIRERMLARMSDTSRIIDRMLLKHLVEKKQSDTDKRLVEITISKKGLMILETLDKKNDEMDGIARGLSTEEAKMLNDLLDKLREG